MELQEPVSRSKPRVSPTLGELLKRVGDARDDTPGCQTTSSHQRVIDLNDAIPHPRSFPFVLSFHNLSYSVKVRRKMKFPGLFCWKEGPGLSEDEVETKDSGMKVLLNDISGEAREGEIMGVLGASGSGKSTLIDALADRIAKDSLKGSVTLNDEVLESKLLKVISAYVMQDDLLFPMLTVEETLMFSAEFRLPRSLSSSKKKARVQALIDQLGLRSAAKTVIGDEGHRGVSGGERRRVSIGIDIIHDPIVLFLDEPTSGLDSTSAFMVVKVLQRIAQSGSIVIMSIHQPSYRILGLLDRLIFLSRGNTVYSGSPSSLPLFFAEFGHPIPETENRTEFALDLIRELEGSPGGTKTLVEFNKSWQRMTNPRTDVEEGAKPSLKDAISASISRGKLVSGTSNDANPASLVPTFANPIWIEMVVLGKRSLKNSKRMPELFGIRLGAVLVTGIILATIFLQLDSSPKGVQERLGFFAFAMSTTFYTCAEAIPVFLQERYIFMRETAYNAYRRSSYVLAHSIISIPALVFLSFAFTGQKKVQTTPMAASLQLSARPFKPHFQSKSLSKPSSIRLATIRCSAATPPKRYSITLLPGDGIGPEVISVAKNVLKLAGSLEGIEFGFQEMPMGGCALDLTGVPLPEETLLVAKQSDAVLLGAIGGYKWDSNEKHLKPETGLLQLRSGLKVFANLRPASVLPQLVDASTLKKEVAEGVDLMVVRELTGGIYFGKPRGFSKNENGEEIGFNTEVYATYEIDRIARIAFETAQKRRGKLCSVDKANVLEASMLWRKRVTAMASEYPDVELSHMYVDNAAMQLVRNPKQFDTIVTNNIFGDILSDEASMITGSIGMLPSASVGESGPGLFEPIHGSAPDIAGQDKANPLATVLSAAMLLRYGLGEGNAAKRIETAVLDTLDRGFRTGDIYEAGTKLVGCKEMGEEVLKAVESQIPAAV